MKKIFVFLFFVFGIHAVQAQAFSWAQCAPDMGLEYLSAVVHADGSVSILADQGGSSFGANYGFFDAAGNNHQNEITKGSQVIIHFDVEGNLQWTHTIYTRENTEVYGMDLDAKDQIVLLCQIKGQYSKPGNYQDPYSEDEEIVDKENDEYKDDEEEEDEGDGPYIYGVFDMANQVMGRVPAGFYSAILSKSGKVVNLTQIKILPSEDFDYGDMKVCNDGSLVFCGYLEEGKLVEDERSRVGRGGANFIVKADITGKLIWYDVIKSSHSSCCSFYMELSHLAVSPNGTVFYSGPLYEDGLFGNQIGLTSKMVHNGNTSTDRMDVFIASYTSEGKLNWVQASNSKSKIEGLCADDQHVYVAFNSYFGNRCFGQEVDTTHSKRMFIFKFDQKGNVLANTATLTTVQDMYILPTKELLLFGYGHYANRPMDKAADATVSFKNRDNFYTAVLSQDLKPISSQSFQLLVGHEYEVFLHYFNGRGYLTGELWGVQTIPASYIDKAFKAGSLYGGGAFCGRLVNY